MATYHFLQGKAKWARLVQPDVKYNCWSLVLYPNKESYEKLLELKTSKDGVDGILNTIKKDEDGYYSTFKRPCSKVIRGKLTPFAPPKVMKEDNQTPLQDALIGNGSDVTVKLELYRYPKPTGGKGSAVRLEAVRVDNLVPYTRENDFTDDEEKQVKGLAEQPEQLF